MASDSDVDLLWLTVEDCLQILVTLQESSP